MTRGKRNNRRGTAGAGTVEGAPPGGPTAPATALPSAAAAVPAAAATPVPSRSREKPAMAKLVSYLRRYSDRERMNHWAIALLFFLAGLSGLAFFHPSLFFFSNLFGGGSWTRILHPFLGVLMVLAFTGLFVRLWRENVLNAADREWLRHSGDMLRGNKAAMPPVGKYNAGQKLVFWAFAVSLLVLIVTGFMFWRPWFAPYFPIAVIRAATLLHAVAALVLVLSVIVHIYAAIWVKGTLRAMTRGTVSEGWARQNHALWHREMTQGK
jgi:formate dehydrogenase subunit gamma